MSCGRNRISACTTVDVLPMDAATLVCTDWPVNVPLKRPRLKSRLNVPELPFHVPETAAVPSKKVRFSQVVPDEYTFLRSAVPEIAPGAIDMPVIVMVSAW